MANITDYLQMTSGGLTLPNAGVYVRMNNNATGTDYISTGLTDGNGMFTINNIPQGTYTVFYGPGPLAANILTSTGQLNYRVSYTAGDSPIFNTTSGNTLVLENNGLKIEQISVEASATTDRLMPPTAVAHSNSDAAIITLLRAPYVDGNENNTFVDWKLSFDSTSHGVIHILGDRSGTDIAPNIFVVELDPRAQSTDTEFQVVRGGFRGSQIATMLDVVQGVGITAIESNTIKLGGGNFILQTTAGDIVTQPSGGMRPFTDGLHDLGSGSFRYNNLFLKSQATIGTGLLVSGGIAMDGATLSAARINMPNTWGLQVAGGDVMTFITGGLINFALAPIALGGGAAPTFGTIGGSGPATAAQNSWMKIRIGGIDTFIPVWR